MSSVLEKPVQQSVGDLFTSIAEDLVQVERIFHQTLDTRRPGIHRLLDQLAHYRGKRLRPALLLLTAQACGEITQAHHVLGAVVEMIHTATLVHDDVLDEASLRRHRLTINASWGNQTSILLGDYLFTHAFHLSSTLDVRACRLIGEATNRVCAGELQQITERGNLQLSEEQYFEIIDAKTAELTACCCRLGALYAGRSEEVAERLALYGRWLGIAFQIADDLLDLVGEERRAGKSLGTDLQQQKLTLPLIRLLAKSPSEKIAKLERILANTENHKRELLLPELQASAVLQETRRCAEEYAAKAARQLDVLPASPARTILETLCQRVVHRDM